MDSKQEQLDEMIATTLRGIIHVPRLKPGSILARPDFWVRSKLVTPNWRTQYPNRIFVDGFFRACHWNSWRVFSSQLERGLSLWHGYACYGGSWTEHSWCMLEGCIVETTSADFRIYFGAELKPDELKMFAERWADLDFTALESSLQERLKVCTMVDGYRACVPYESAEYAHSIGRERDWKTREIKEGLGR